MFSLVVIAGFPASGKTAILRCLVKEATGAGLSVAVANVRCYRGDDSPPPWGGGIPWRTWTSESYCPDHQLAQKLDEMETWARGRSCEVLFVETAGLCARCSPFPDHCVALFAVDYSSGLGLPHKVGPMLTTCDVCICTRPDRATQTERLMFHAQVKHANPTCSIIALNGLTGEGGRDLWQLVRHSQNDGRAQDEDVEHGIFRSSLPEFFCSFCLGRDHVGIQTL